MLTLFAKLRLIMSILRICCDNGTMERTSHWYPSLCVRQYLCFSCNCKIWPSCSAWLSVPIIHCQPSTLNAGICIWMRHQKSFCKWDNIPLSTVPTHDFCGGFRREWKAAVLVCFGSQAEKVTDGLVSMGCHCWQLDKSAQGGDVLWFLAFLLICSFFRALICSLTSLLASNRLLNSLSLRKLLAGNNRLQRVPDLLDHIPLEALDLQHNKLAELPESLFYKALKWVSQPPFSLQIFQFPFPFCPETILAITWVL